MADGITSAAILKRTGEMLRGNAGPAVGAFAGLAGLSVALDMLVGPDGRGNLAISGLATVLAQYLVTRRVMEEHGLLSSGAGGYRATGFGAVFGVCLLSNLGIILGLVLLIVPGVFLAIRWFAAVPALLGEEASVTGALGESWEKTKGHGGAVFGAMLLVYLPLLAAIGLAFAIGVATAQGGPDPSGALVFSVVLNALTTSAAVIAWHAAVAFWELRSPAVPALAEVFA